MTTRYLFAGVDPGLSGAVALYDAFENLLDTIDMPVFDNRKKTLDVARLAGIFDNHGPRIQMAAIEHVHSMPKQGVASSFTFGHAAGAAEGILAAARIPYTLVRPEQWKRAMQCAADKDAARQRASQLLPHHTDQWPLKKHDGRAEAALLAVLAQRLSAKGKQ